MTDTVTLSKADHELLLRAKALVDKTWKDPKIGGDFRKSAKETFSDIVIPEDTVDPVVAPLKSQIDSLAETNKKLLERLDAKDKAETERAQTVSMENALANARKKYSLTDEGFQKMVDRMKETSNFTDAEAAAAWVSSNEPPAKPTTGPSWAPQSLDLYGSKTPNDDYKLLHTDPDTFFDNTVAQILSEAAA